MKFKLSKKNLSLLGIFLLVFSFVNVTIFVVGQAINSSAGTVTVGNASPSASDIKYVDNTYSVVAAFDPDNTAIWGLNVTIADGNTLADIKNITWYFFDDSAHTSDWQSATPTGNDLITVSWNESDDVWILSDNAFEWDLQSPVDPGAASGLSTFDFSATFDISRAAYAESDWNCTVIVYDDQEATDTAVASSFVTMNSYWELAFSSGTFAYGSVTGGSTNNTMSSNMTVDFWVNFNNWELVLNVSDWTAGGESDVDNEVQNTMVWSEIATEGATNSLWLRNTQAVGLGTWDDQTRMTSETPFSLAIHTWFTDPTGEFTDDIEYDINYWIEVRPNT